MVKNHNFRNRQEIKHEQINYLLGDLEKNLEDYKESIEIKEKQLAEAKRILIAAKQSFDKLAKENRDLKAYIENLKQHFQKQQIDFLKQQKAYFSKNNTPKKYKKIVFEEENESENEPEFEEEEESENEEIIEEPQIKKAKKKKKNIFDYINKNAKRHKQQKHTGRHSQSNRRC